MTQVDEPDANVALYRAWITSVGEHVLHEVPRARGDLEDAPGADRGGQIRLVPRLHPCKRAREVLVDPVVARPAVDLGPDARVLGEPAEPAPPFSQHR